MASGRLGATVATVISARVTVRAVVRKVSRAGGEILEPRTQGLGQNRPLLPEHDFGSGEGVLGLGRKSSSAWSFGTGY
jgi:hypothetical protein